MSQHISNDEQDDSEKIIASTKKILKNYHFKKAESKDRQQFKKFLFYLILILLLFLGIFVLIGEITSIQKKKSQQQELQFQTVMKYANLHNYSQTAHFIKSQDPNSKIVDQYLVNDYIPHRKQVDVHFDGIMEPNFNGNNRQFLVVYQIPSINKKRYILITYRASDKEILSVDSRPDKTYKKRCEITEQLIKEMRQQGKTKQYNRSKILKLKRDFDQETISD